MLCTPSRSRETAEPRSCPVHHILQSWDSACLTLQFYPQPDRKTHISISQLSHQLWWEIKEKCTTLLSHFYPPTTQTSTHHEDVGDGIQDDKDSFAVLSGEQCQKRLKHIGLNKVNHLLNSAPAGVVCNSPNSFFLSFVVTLQIERKKTNMS